MVKIESLIKSRQLCRFFWSLGFVLITFDKIFIHYLNGFRIKASYYCFAIAALLLIVEHLLNNTTWIFLKRNFQIILKSPIIIAVAIFSYAILMADSSALPSRSIYYSLWGFFNIFFVFLAGLWNFHPELNNKEEIGTTLRYWYYLLLFSLGLLSIIIIIDNVAFFYGYKDGLIGYNQGVHELWYESSRPHAFSSDPSYLALYFCLALPFLLFGKFHTQSILGNFVKRINLMVAVLAIIVLLITFYKSIMATITLILLLIYINAIFFDKIFASKIIKFLFIGFIAALLFFLITPKKQLNIVYDRMLYKLFSTSKINEMEYTRRILKQTPLAGIGYASAYSYVCDTSTDKCFFSLKNDEKFKRESIQNLWLEMILELGWVGVSLLGVFVVFYIFQFFYRNRLDNLQLFHFISIYSFAVFYIFTANWFANFSRTDVWIWLSIWSTSIPLQKYKSYKI